jgi:uncharacterized protein YwgA
MQIDDRAILHKVAEEFGLKRVNTKERLKLQKTIYLLQTYGLKLGYGFSWYKYGPYSQDLVYDAYAVLGPEKHNYEKLASMWNFSRDCLKKFEEFKKICGDILRSAEDLELVASVDYIRSTWYPSAKRSDIVKLLKQHKMHFFNGQPIPEEKINKAFDISYRLRQN